MQIDESILTNQRIAARELGTMARMREQQPANDLDLAPRIERVRQATTEVRQQLGQLAGTAAHDIESWLMTTEQQVVELALLTEAVALFCAEAEVEGKGAVQFLPALDSVARNLEHDAETAAQSWDGVRQLVGPLEDPRFAAVPEVATALARYRELAVRVDAELAPRLASVRARPAVEEVREVVDTLVYAIDQADQELVLQRRAELRQALGKLPDGVDLPEVNEVRERAASELARSEQELGDGIVLHELELLERVIEPFVDQVERGLAMKSAERVIEYAPRLRACLPLLSPYAAHLRAQRLGKRGWAAIDRIASELGAACEREVEAADAVPQFAIEPGTGTRVEAAVRRLNEVLAGYRTEHLTTQARFEADVDVVTGTPPAVTERVIDDVDRCSRELVRAARRADELAAELRAIAPEHPAVASTKVATPGLIRRVQTWKARLATLSSFSNALEEGNSCLTRAREAAEAGAPDSPYQALDVWPEVLLLLDHATINLEAAAKILPDEPERLEPLRAKAAALRQLAIEQLTSVCVAESTRIATTGDMDEARRFADALLAAVPDSAENARIAAMLEGTADARERAALEIDQHGALIRRAAETAARAARSAYDAWVAERPPVVTLACSIVGDVGSFRGKFVSGRCSHLGLSLAEEAGTIRGDIYMVDYDPEVRRQLAEGMALLDGMFASRAEQTVAAAAVGGLCTTTQHYPRDAYYHAEIVGTAMHTPMHEVRDQHANLLGTISGTPYPVPRVVIRALATTYFVIVPGETPSHETITFE